ncbi:MAG: GntR family transcriptional regulator [Kiritimatiellae bacterium]|nr:GntR family transcriptional regulator [Kiritimatiellia bacterium]
MKYLEIYSSLKKSIEKREFSADHRIPSEPELCDRFGVARNTVRQALALLLSQGLIEKHKGKGSFITPKGERKTSVIGLLIPDFSSASFFSSLKSELENNAAKLGYRVRLETSRRTTDDEIVKSIRKAARKLAVDRVEGVIFRPHLNPEHIDANKEILSIFQHTKTPVVLIDSDISPRPERSDCDLVAVDNVCAGRRIAAHLLDNGRTKIAFMMSGVEISSNANWENRLFGIAGEVAVRGMDDGVSTLRFPPDDTESLRVLFRSRRRPDAIACGNDRAAAMLVESLKAIGKRVPEDVAVTGFDDESFARSSVPPLTTIRQPAGLIAKTAFKTLLARIRYPQNDHREILLDAPLIIRKST